MGWRFGALVVLSSCIVYRVESSPEPGEEDEIDVIDPPPPARLPDSLSLVIDEAVAGDTIRTTVIAEGAGLTDLVGLRFDRDITVIDSVIAAREADLLLRVAVGAEPGAVDLVAQFRGGATLREGDAFTILPAETTTTTGDTATTTLPTGDTGPSTPGDTGVSTRDSDTGMAGPS